MIEFDSKLGGIEVYGLTVLDIRKIESKLSDEEIKPVMLMSVDAFREPGITAVALTLTPVVVGALIAILIVPRSGKKKEIRIVKKGINGDQTEIVIKESNYRSGTLSPESLKVLSEFFKVDVGNLLTKNKSRKE